jgi:DeoR/GlpR family transcriptional regulator of sugar metabolism
MFISNTDAHIRTRRDMSANRQAQIQALLTEGRDSSVDFLAQQLGVCTMTIRRDLAALAQAGKVIRTHGGATPAERVLFEFQFLRRSRDRETAKEAIAAAAAKLVRDGQSVMMDSGTTTMAVARRLQSRSALTLITTSLPIAAALQHAAGIKVLLLGGYLRKDAPDLIGPMTEANLESLRADIAFLGADGLGLDGAVYSAFPEVARMASKMAESAKAVYVVADSSKIGQTALMRFGNLAHYGGLVTDGEISRKQAGALRQAGVNLIQ